MIHNFSCKLNYYEAVSKGLKAIEQNNLIGYNQC